MSMTKADREREAEVLYLAFKLHMEADELAIENLSDSLWDRVRDEDKMDAIWADFVNDILSYYAPQELTQAIMRYRDNDITNIARELLAIRDKSEDTCWQAYHESVLEIEQQLYGLYLPYLETIAANHGVELD